MSFAVQWQLQIKLEFCVENIALKDVPWDVFTWYLVFWNVSGSNKVFSKSDHVSYCLETYPKFVMSSLKDRTLLLRTYHSSFEFRISWFQMSPKKLVRLIFVLCALSCNLNYYYCFLPYDKLWKFVSWNIWPVCYSASWHFMHVIKKHRELPVTFAVIENITSPVEFLKDFDDMMHINNLFSYNVKQFMVFWPGSHSVHYFLWEGVMRSSLEFTLKYAHNISSSWHKASRDIGCLPQIQGSEWM